MEWRSRIQISGQNLRYVRNAVAISLVYIAAAKFGLSLAETTKQVTIIWPPTGIALVTLFLFGKRYWPVILFSAFVANVYTQEPFLVALFIAIGNTLEAVVGVWLLRRITKFSGDLATVKSVLGIVILAAGLSTAVSATIGTTTLMIGGLAAWHNYSSVWSLWWVGDMMGDLLLAPFLFVVTSGKFIISAIQNRIEWATLILLTVATSLFIFTTGVSDLHQTKFSLEYLIFPLVIWAALRFNETGATTVTLISTVIATWGTAKHFGPFIQSTSVQTNLVFLYIFMAVISITSMLLGAVVAERNKSRLELLQYSQSLVTAKNRLLRNAAIRRVAEKEKDQFISMASHELKTPLTSAKVYLEILSRQLQRITGKEDEPAIEYAEQVSRALDRLTKLTSDLIDATRSQTGKLRLARRRVRSDKLIRQIVKDLRLMTDDHPIHLNLLTKADIRVDEVRIRQVLVNLLTNANKYSPKGREIIVTAAADKKFLIVTVQDFGPGIPKKEQPKIFEPFYQAPGSVRAKQGGLGLGLHIAKQIVELHKGNIWVDSQPPKGATFAFSIPLLKKF